MIFMRLLRTDPVVAVSYVSRLRGKRSGRRVRPNWCPCLGHTLLERRLQCFSRGKSPKKASATT